MFKNKKKFIVNFVVLFLMFLLVNVNTAGAGLIAEWYFDLGEGSEIIDSSGNNNDGTIYEATWTQGIMGSALLFDGMNDYVEVTDSDSLDITGEITIEAWVKKQEVSRAGSILSKGAYSLKIGDDEKAYFELCNGSEEIMKVGDLGDKSRVYSLTVYDGKLYAGTEGLGKIYYYNGGTDWIDVGQLESEKNVCVFSLIVYKSKLYAGDYSSGRVYRYDGDSVWTKLGSLGTADYVFSLAVYDGKLYAGTGEGFSGEPWGKVYCYEEGIGWTDVGLLGSSIHVVSLAVYNGKLYAGTLSSGSDKVFCYEGGTTWTGLGSLGSNSTAQSLAVYNGKLYAGTASFGEVYRYNGGTTWTNLGRLGGNYSVYSLAVYNDKLYAGVGLTGHVYCYDGMTWTNLGRLGVPADCFCVHTLAVYDGKLYAGTGFTMTTTDPDQFLGKIYSIGDGVAVYSSSNIDDQFTHIAGTYNGRIAKLFVNGELENSINKTMVIDTNSLNLFIGNSYGSSRGGYSSSGEENLKGIIDQVCIYNEALPSEEIMRHYYAIKGGFISGKVTNLSEAPIVGAVVSSGRYSDITDISGNYIISVPIGTYVLVASKIWYEQKTEENVKVELGETTIVDFQLKGNLKETHIYPNPYIKGKSLAERISFINLPKEATIRIYTVSGKLVKTIKHLDTVDGNSEEWNISDIASGIYVYTVISSQGKKTGKVSIIK